MKICKECKIEKELTEFVKYETKHSLYCVHCREIKKEERLAKKREHQKEYYKNNLEYYSNYNNKYYKDNKEYYTEYFKDYNSENKESINNTRRKHRSEEILINPIFKLKENIRGLIRLSLKNGSYRKNSKTHEILGCSFEELMLHLNDNIYGFRYEDNLKSHKYDIDHIIPISSARNEAEVVLLNHYTNFQLLPSKYNQKIKRDNTFDKDNLILWLMVNNY